jgi:hypothetical protein
MLRGDTNYPERLDVPYRAGGFSARDRVLAVDYIFDLLGIVRSGQPDTYIRAWSQMAGPAGRTGTLGREFAPRYDALARETARSEWNGSPATLYSNASCIRMARAVIAIMRQGRDERGLFRNQEHLKELMRDLPCPMTGEPVICKAEPHRCDLWYRVARGQRRGCNDWELHVRLESPQRSPQQSAV